MSILQPYILVHRPDLRRILQTTDPVHTSEIPMADSTAVKVDVAAAGPAAAGVPKHAKLAHILTILVSGVIALCVSSVLADGQSVIILKPVKDLPIVTNPELKKKVTLPPGSKINLKYNLAELLGPGYGVGLHHDQASPSTGLTMHLALTVAQPQPQP